jgi:hypothetical protein
LTTIIHRSTLSSPLIAAITRPSRYDTSRITHTFIPGRRIIRLTTVAGIAPVKTPSNIPHGIAIAILLDVHLIQHGHAIGVRPVDTFDNVFFTGSRAAPSFVDRNFILLNVILGIDRLLRPPFA